MADIEIYSSNFCPFCHRAKALLKRKGAGYREHNVDGRQEARAEMIHRAAGRTSVPQIFIDGRHIGGCDDLYALEAAAKLDDLLAL